MDLSLLVTGASGLLGSKIVEIAVARGCEVYSAYNEHHPSLGKPVKLDVTDQVNVRRVISELKPEVIIHAAAMTNVDKCELDKDLALKINYEGTANVADAAKSVGAFLIYISTDYVFKGDKGLYKEDDETDPVNFYGYSKLKGEEIVKEIVDKYCIARTSVLYGSKPARGKVNFVLWLIDKLRKGEFVRVVSDQFISPTLNTNLAEMLLEVADKELTGVYHLAGASRVSRLDLAFELAEVFNLDRSLIRSAKMDDMNWVAKRPRDSSLDVSKAARTLRNKPLTLREALTRLKFELEGS